MPSLLIYGIVALAFLGLGAYAKIEHSGKLEAQAQTEACNTKVEAQNTAIAALAAESAKKQAAGAQALAKAEGKAKVWESNATRLQAVLTNRKPTDATDCKAAWQEIRKP